MEVELLSGHREIELRDEIRGFLNVKFLVKSS